MKNEGGHPINEETCHKYNITPKPFRNTHMMKNRPSRFKEMTVLPFSHPILLRSGCTWSLMNDSHPCKEHISFIIIKLKSIAWSDYLDFLVVLNTCIMAEHFYCSKWLRFEFLQIHQGHSWEIIHTCHEISTLSSCYHSVGSLEINVYQLKRLSNMWVTQRIR